LKIFWKTRAYAQYLARHKWFVFRAGVVTAAPVWRLLIHDWTKLLPCEWFPYADNFYGSYPKKADAPADYQGRTREQVVAAYRLAWAHHLHWNKHHWQYWIYIGEDRSIQALPMPDKYIREMVADWLGAGRAITGEWEAVAWYGKNKDRMMLHPETRGKVEILLLYANRILSGRDWS